jgi:hypothetical protein
MKVGKAKGKHRIRMITAWTGNLDGDPQGEKTSVAAGEEVDVGISVVRALVLQYNKAELVTVEEIEAKAKEPEKKKQTGKTASQTKGRRVPPKDKMVKESTDK